MVGRNIAQSQMFSFSSRLFFHKHAVSKKTGYVSIYVYVYISVSSKYEDDLFPLKLRWPHDKIDLVNGVLLSRTKDDPDVQDYNMIIQTERAKYNEIAKKYRLSDRTLDMEAFKRELRIGDSKKSLVAYMELKRNELFKEKEISLRTWKNVGSTIAEIRQFDEGVQFVEINQKWMQRFKLYLKRKVIFKSPKKKKLLAPGTIWTRIRDLKAYLNFANEEVSIYVDPQAVEFPNPEVEVNTTYLNRAELRRLMLLHDPLLLTSIQYNVLRGFLFTCFTSMRISDLYLANTDWQLSQNQLVFVQRKNARRKPKTIRIPLIPIAESLISDVLRNFFALPSEQEYNRTLKDLATMAEIKKNLTSHVGRHTFGYLFMITVGNLYALKEILGHEKIQTTERYAHLDEDYRLQQVLRLQAGFEDVAQGGVFRSSGG